MSDEDWQAGFAKSLGVFLNGDAIPTRDERGERVVDDSFYVMFNAHSRAGRVRAAGVEVGRAVDGRARHDPGQGPAAGAGRGRSEVGAGAQIRVDALVARAAPHAPGQPGALMRGIHRS